MANKQNDDDGFLSGCCGEICGSCLIELLMAGIGCTIPTIIFLVVAAFSIGMAKKPVQRFGTQMVACVKRMRQRPNT